MVACESVINEWNDKSCQSQYCYNYRLSDTQACYNKSDGVCTADDMNGCNSSSALDICILPTQAPDCDPGGGGGPPPTPISTNPIYGKRILNFKNNCPSPVKVYTTMDDAEYVSNSLNSLENDMCTTPIFGRVGGVGKKCTNFRQFITDTIGVGDTASYTEELFKTDDMINGNGDNVADAKGCLDPQNKTNNSYCRPGANYTPIWADVSPNEIVDGIYPNGHLGSIQGKYEITYGAQNQRDTFDVSGMIEGGCGGHTSPFDNDLGFIDITPCPTQGVTDDDEPLQVSHSVSKLYKALEGEFSDDHIYHELSTMVTYLKTDEGADGTNWRNSQAGDGCFNKQGDWNLGSHCKPVESNDKYVCGYPYKYTHNGSTYYYRPDVGDVGQTKKICTNPYLTNVNGVNTPSPCIEAPNSAEVLTAMRNDLYQCSVQQTDIGSNRNKINNGGHDEFIGLKVEPKGCTSVKGTAAPYCHYDNQTNFATAGNCEDGYMFNFDDAHATSECFLGSDTIAAATPAYDITLCPLYGPPEPEPGHTCPSPTGPDNGTWIKNGNEWNWTCNDVDADVPDISAHCTEGGGTADPTPHGPTVDSCIPAPINCVGSWGSVENCDMNSGNCIGVQTYSITTPSANGGSGCEATGGQTRDHSCLDTDCSDPSPPGPTCPSPSASATGGRWVMTAGSDGDPAIWNWRCGNSDATDPGISARCTDGTTDAAQPSAPDDNSCVVHSDADCVGAWGDWTDCIHVPGGACQRTRLYRISREGSGGSPCEHGDWEQGSEPCPGVSPPSCSEPATDPTDPTDDTTWGYFVLSVFAGFFGIIIVFAVLRELYKKSKGKSWTVVVEGLAVVVVVLVVLLGGGEILYNKYK